MKRMVRYLLEAAENLPYVNLATERILELSGRDERRYLRFSSRYGKFCKRICKKNGWEPSVGWLDEILKEERTDG